MKMLKWMSAGVLTLIALTACAARSEPADEATQAEVSSRAAITSMDAATRNMTAFRLGGD